MRRLWAWLMCMVALVAMAAGITLAAEFPSPWVASGNPTFTKLIQLKDTVPPDEKNIDCDRITVRFVGMASAQEDCVVNSPIGLGGAKGMIFNGASEAIPVVPPNPFIGLSHIPNQEMVYTYSTASTFGMYMHFYRTVRTNMKFEPDFFNGQWQFTLTKNPDFTLKNLAGKSQPMNPGSLAFSENGDWMIVDFPFQGFIRVNMATMETIPFAPSMNQGSDYSNYNAQLTISNDGRYAAIKPRSANEFRIYDIDSCVNAVLPVDPLRPKCQSRDYWPYISQQLTGLKALYQPRFTSQMQLYVTAQYEYSANNYKVAKYSLTAPGENPSGIEYLGMGDSFASGQGAFSYVLGTDTANNKCHLSGLSYPFLISSILFNGGNSVACSGAKMNDVVNQSRTYKGQAYDNIEKKDRQNINEILNSYLPGYLGQKDFIDKYNPQTLTLSIGGNDIGFANVVKQCVMPAIRNTTCYPTAEDQIEIADRIKSKQNDLTNTYRTINKPGRKVFIIGYPQIVVRQGNCANNVHLDESEIQLFTNLTDVLNQTISKAAMAAGVTFVDVSNAFEGHRMCENQSREVAVNGFTAGNDDGLKKFKFIGAESYHPNALGHELLKNAILKQTDNLTKTSLGAAVGGSSLPAPDAPASGRTINLTISDDDLAADIIAPLSSMQLHITGKTAQLKSASSFSVKIDAQTNAIGTTTSDAGGTVSGTVQLPENISCGPHTLHVYGLNIIKQPVDIFKEIYVSPDTGCPDAQGPCGPIAPANVDKDADGFDDACDPVISDPPQTAQYKAYLTGSSIHVINNAP